MGQRKALVLKFSGQITHIDCRTCNCMLEAKSVNDRRKNKYEKIFIYEKEKISTLYASIVVMIKLIKLLI